MIILMLICRKSLLPTASLLWVFFTQNLLLLILITCKAKTLGYFKNNKFAFLEKLHLARVQFLSIPLQDKSWRNTFRNSAWFFERLLEWIADNLGWEIFLKRTFCSGNGQLLKLYFWLTEDDDDEAEARASTSSGVATTSCVPVLVENDKG